MTEDPNPEANMNRPRIDVAILAQLDRRTSLLRDVVRSGGKDRWMHLHSHGHHHATVLCAVRQGYLNLTGPDSRGPRKGGLGYEITDAGKQYLDEIDAQALQEQTRLHEVGYVREFNSAEELIAAINRS